MSTNKINFRADDGQGAFKNETPFLLRSTYSVAGFLSPATIVPYPPVSDPYLLELDVSHWQGPTDFSVAKARGVRAVWIKASQGVWVNSMFEDHTQAAEGVIDFGYYHFIDPSQPESPETSARHCAGLVSGINFLSMWVDVERSGDLGPQGLLDYLIRWCDTFFGLVDTVKEVYTRLSFFNPWVARSSYWSDNGIRLHAARYHLGLESPWSDGNYRPIDWTFTLDDFDGWQYSADGNGLGEYFGASSDSIDLNLFKGDSDHFDEVYGIGDPDPPVIEPPPIIEQDLEMRVTKLEKEVKGINVEIEDHDKRLDNLEESQ